MTARFLLDTSVVSRSLTSSGDSRWVEALDARVSECVIGAPVWHELLYGFEKMPAGRRRTALKAYIDENIGALFPILPYDEHAAAWHASERVRLERLGRAPPFVDGQIASIARTNDLTLVTTNVRHFQLFDGLVVEDWSTA